MERIRNTHAYQDVFYKGAECICRLYSYRTLVCEVHVKSKQILLSPASRCSRTTIRHLSEFLRGFNVSYKTAKNCLIDPTLETVEHENGYTIYVSLDEEFNFKPTGPYCLLG